MVLQLQAHPAALVGHGAQLSLRDQGAQPETALVALEKSRQRRCKKVSFTSPLGFRWMWKGKTDFKYCNLNILTA